MSREITQEKPRRQHGFTLIELLVAMSIFVVVSVVVSGLLISGIKAQRHTLSSQRLLDQTSFAMEYMSRSLRMAKKEDGTINCLSSVGYNYEVISNGIRFINSLEEDDCQSFFLEDNKLKHAKTSSPAGDDLTSDNLYIESLQFLVNGDLNSDPSHSVQPRVTISMNIRDNSQNAISQPSLKMQTTISQRNLDVQP